MAAGRYAAVLKVSEDGLITFYDRQEKDLGYMTVGSRQSTVGSLDRLHADAGAEDHHQPAVVWGSASGRVLRVDSVEAQIETNARCSLANQRRRHRS